MFAEKREAIFEGLRAEKLFVAAFVLLNILDAYLTGTAIALGSSEFNPATRAFGGSMLLKGAIAVLITVALLMFRRGKLLRPLSVGMLLVVVWNSIAVWSWV